MSNKFLLELTAEEQQIAHNRRQRMIAKQKTQKIKDQIKYKQKKQYKIQRAKFNIMRKKKKQNEVNFLLTDNDLNDEEKHIMYNTNKIEIEKAKQQNKIRELQHQQEKEYAIRRKKFNQTFQQKKWLNKQKHDINFLLTQ